MDMIRLYCYTSVPLLTCNMLFYSLTSLSASISSSQNVVKFISEHKECDSIVFKNKISEVDLENKMAIINAIMYDIIRKYSHTDDEFERAKYDIRHPTITDDGTEHNNGFALIEIKSPSPVLERIDGPIKVALTSTSETMQKINTLLLEIREKISNHYNSYIKNILSISLQVELNNLNKLIKILDTRLYLLLELLKIYMPFNHNNNKSI